MGFCSSPLQSEAFEGSPPQFLSLYGSSLYENAPNSYRPASNQPYYNKDGYVINKPVPFNSIDIKLFIRCRTTSANSIIEIILELPL